MPSKANYSAFDLPTRLVGGPPGYSTSLRTSGEGVKKEEAKTVETRPPKAVVAAQASAAEPGELAPH
jgi:hypothetical protein